MARLSADTPFIHPDCEITGSSFGAYIEIGKGSRVNNSYFGDYSYCDRYADVANAQIGKFGQQGCVLGANGAQRKAGRKETNQRR